MFQHGIQSLDMEKKLDRTLLPVFSEHALESILRGEAGGLGESEGGRRKGGRKRPRLPAYGDIQSSVYRNSNRQAMECRL